MEISVLSEIFPNLRSQYQVISLPKGNVFFLNFLYPSNSDIFFKIEIKPNNGKRLISKEDLLLVVNSIHPSGIGARELKFVRFKRNDISLENLNFGQPTTNSRLRNILKSSTELLHYSLGSMENSLTYSDETLISGFDQDSGWILTDPKVSEYLPENERYVSIFVEHTKKGIARVVNEKEAYEKLEDMKLPNTKVMGVFKVTYCIVSKKVVEIVNLSTKKTSLKIIVSSSYPQKYVNLGARIPENL